MYRNNPKLIKSYPDQLFSNYMSALVKLYFTTLLTNKHFSILQIELKYSREFSNVFFKLNQYKQSLEKRSRLRRPNKNNMEKREALIATLIDNLQTDFLNYTKNLSSEKHAFSYQRIHIELFLQHTLQERNETVQAIDFRSKKSPYRKGTFSGIPYLTSPSLKTHALMASSTYNDFSQFLSEYLSFKKPFFIKQSLLEMLKNLQTDTHAFLIRLLGCNTQKDCDKDFSWEPIWHKQSATDILSIFNKFETTIIKEKSKYKAAQAYLPHILSTFTHDILGLIQFNSLLSKPGFESNQKDGEKLIDEILAIIFMISNYCIGFYMRIRSQLVPGCKSSYNNYRISNKPKLHQNHVFNLIIPKYAKHQYAIILDDSHDERAIFDATPNRQQNQTPFRPILSTRYINFVAKMLQNYINFLENTLAKKLIELKKILYANKPSSLHLNRNLADTIYDISQQRYESKLLSPEPYGCINFIHPLKVYLSIEEPIVYTEEIRETLIADTQALIKHLYNTAYSLKAQRPYNTFAEKLLQRLNGLFIAYPFFPKGQERIKNRVINILTLLFNFFKISSSTTRYIQSNKTISDLLLFGKSEKKSIDFNLKKPFSSAPGLLTFTLKYIYPSNQKYLVEIIEKIKSNQTVRLCLCLTQALKILHHGEQYTIDMHEEVITPSPQKYKKLPPKSPAIKRTLDDLKEFVPSDTMSTCKQLYMTTNSTNKALDSIKKTIEKLIQLTKFNPTKILEKIKLITEKLAKIQKKINSETVVIIIILDHITSCLKAFPGTPIYNAKLKRFTLNTTQNKKKLQHETQVWLKMLHSAYTQRNDLSKLNHNIVDHYVKLASLSKASEKCAKNILIQLAGKISFPTILNRTNDAVAKITQVLTKKDASQEAIEILCSIFKPIIAAKILYPQWYEVVGILRQYLEVALNQSKKSSKTREKIKIALMIFQQFILSQSLEDMQRVVKDFNNNKHLEKYIKDKTWSIDIQQRGWKYSRLAVAWQKIQCLIKQYTADEADIMTFSASITEKSLTTDNLTDTDSLTLSDSDDAFSGSSDDNPKPPLTALEQAPNGLVSFTFSKSNFIPVELITRMVQSAVDAQKKPDYVYNLNLTLDQSLSLNNASKEALLQFLENQKKKLTSSETRQCLTIINLNNMHFMLLTLRQIKGSTHAFLADSMGNKNANLVQILKQKLDHTELYLVNEQFNNNCGILVYYYAKILIYIEDDNFNASYLNKVIQHRKLNQKNSQTQARLDFANACLKLPGLESIYSKVAISKQLLS